MKDYLVVGLGLAGLAFCDILERNNKRFAVFNDTSQTASRVAGGLYNPVILKRFTLAWDADGQLARLPEFYGTMERKLGVRVNQQLPVWRRFASTEEQNLWFQAADRPLLGKFMATAIQVNANKAIDAPFGFGKVRHTGKIALKKLLLAYEVYLEKKGLLHRETFDFGALEVRPSGIAYKGLKAKNIVFATGFGLKKNPLFNYLPLVGTKGEYLRVHAPDLAEKRAIKAHVFSIPEENDRYLIGASYQWHDFSNLPTPDARKFLIEKWKTFMRCDFEPVEQLAGIRPTVKDRRPLVGRHPKYPNCYVLNGFGSRGVMIAPTASEALYQLIEAGHPLPLEMDCARFTKTCFQE